MKQFLYEKHNDSYWEVDILNMKLFNFNGGYHDINEFSDDWLNGELVAAESWHDLYQKTGFNPLEGTIAANSGWLDPEGTIWSCEAHLTGAEEICDIAFGITDSDIDCADYLKSLGWVKITSSCMFDFYVQDSMYLFMSPPQYQFFVKWCKIHKKPIPQDIIVRERNYGL